jgi:protein phosphatase
MSAGEVIVSVYGLTDVGRTRGHNEDAFLVADLATGDSASLPLTRTMVAGDRGLLLMVADGMGGAAAGEVASSMAVDAVLGELRLHWVDGPPSADPTAFAIALHGATKIANDRIHRYATEHPENRGMGTTATIAGILGDFLYVAQVGDSRAYLIRGRRASQITKDQSLMQRLIEAGEITAEEAEVSERRNIILQALGPESYVKIDVTRQQLRRGDVVVLCSDGLSGVVRDVEIAEIVGEGTDLVAASQQLIARANDNGGPDNITVVTARFDGDGLAEPAASDAVGHSAFFVGDITPVTPVPRVGSGEYDTSPSLRVSDAIAAAAAAAASAAPRRVPTREIVRPRNGVGADGGSDAGTASSLPGLIGALLACLALLVGLYLYIHLHAR